MGQVAMGCGGHGVWGPLWGMVAIGGMGNEAGGYGVWWPWGTETMGHGGYGAQGQWGMVAMGCGGHRTHGAWWGPWDVVAVGHMERGAW